MDTGKNKATAKGSVKARGSRRLWLRTVARTERGLHQIRHLLGVLVLVGGALLIGSLGGQSNGGDTRALADLAWWIAYTGNFDLTDSPGYRTEATTFGYWAFRGEDGRVLSVYPPGVALLGAIGYRALAMFGMVYDAQSTGIGTVPIATIMMAIAGWCLWYVVTLRHGMLSALIAWILFLFGTLVASFMAKGLWTQTGGLFCQGIAAAAATKVITGAHRRGHLVDGTLLVLSGVAAGWAYFCRPTFLFWTAPFSLFLLVQVRWEIWKFLLGLGGSAVGGFALNAAASGSWRGAYGDKVSTDAGFVFDPGTVWDQGLAILFSPGRGLLLFSPWFLLAFAAILICGMRRFRGCGFLLVNAAFLIAILGMLSAFKMWHGGWSPGPRLQTDAALSAAIVVATAVRWLLLRPWGLLVVIALAVPSLDTNLRVAGMTTNPPDAYISNHHATAMQWTWDWDTAAFRWYRTGAAPQRDLKNIQAEPRMLGVQISAEQIDAAIFEGRGMKFLGDVKVFSPRQHEAEIVFIPSAELTGDIALAMAVTMDLTGLRWGEMRHLEFRLNETVWKKDFIAQVDKNPLVFEVPSGTLRPEAENSFLIVDRRPKLQSLGEVYITVKSLSFHSISDESRERFASQLIQPRK